MWELGIFPPGPPITTTTICRYLVDGNSPGYPRTGRINAEWRQEEGCVATSPIKFNGDGNEPYATSAFIEIAGQLSTYHHN